MIKKSRLINLRIEDQLLDEIEKIAIKKFDDNTSEAIRYLVNLGVKFELIPKNELDKEKIEEITNEMNQKIKLVLTPMKKERMRLFQVNKVYLSSKGEEGFVKKGNLIVKITIIGGGLCLSGALWLSRYLF